MTDFISNQNKEKMKYKILIMSKISKVLKDSILRNQYY